MKKREREITDAEGTTWRKFLRGIGSVLEIMPPPRHYLPEGSDEEAIQRDWEAVAADLSAAITETANGETL